MPYFKQCGHTECAGAGGYCYKCVEKGLNAKKDPDPILDENKPKKKIGRPTTKTKDERILNSKQWHIDNPRADYFLNYSRERRGVMIGDYVISNGKQWKQERRDKGRMWGRFATSHTYTSKRHAENAAKKSVDCVAMVKLSSAAKTIANHKAMVLRGEM